MTFRVQGTIGINGTQAKAEARAVAGELRKVAGDSTGMARATREAGEGARRLGAGAADAAQDIRALAAAQQQAATDAVMMERNNGLAAGSVANLTAQFNDIAVMLAAGQNPLQLAMQQGMQITQIFGPGTGAAGAVQALGQGLMSMLSPLNLVTIGGIALGATIFQWAMNSAEEVKTLEDRLHDLRDAVDAYSDAAEAAGASSDELTERYGSMAAAAREASLAIQAAEQARALAALTGGASATAETFGGFSGPVGDLIGSDREETLRRIRIELGLTSDEALQVGQRLEALAGANGPQQIADAALAARQALVAAGVAADNELAIALSNVAQEASRVVGVTETLSAALAEANRQQLIGWAAPIREALAPMAELVAARAQEAVEAARANAAAQERISLLQAESVLNNQILIFGRDSELVAQNRLAAERESLAAMLEAEGVAADLAARVLEAWDGAKGFNAEAAGMQGFLSAAAGAASGIAANLWNAVRAQITLKAEQADAFRQTQQRLAADGKISSGRGSDPRIANDLGRGRFTYTGPALDAQNNVITRGSQGGARGGRGASAVEEEARAVEDLIEKLEREIALERELDPVKREMIRYREQMSEATAAERAQVEALIAQRERERAASESLRWVGEQAGDSLVDALMGAADAGERLIDTLKRAVLQALLLGSGPLGGLFGGGIFGGILGGFGGGGDIAFPSLYSEGGMVYGEGGPTDDKVPARLSAGEFVVNAAATRRNRRLLEAINAKGFATGGMVGGNAPTGSDGNIGGPVILNANIDARGAQDPAAVEAAARRGMAKAMEEYRRTQLPMDVRRVLDRPNMTRF